VIESAGGPRLRDTDSNMDRWEDSSVIRTEFPVKSENFCLIVLFDFQFAPLGCARLVLAKRPLRVVKLDATALDICERC
jgi:hypothetical protein